MSTTSSDAGCGINISAGIGRSGERPAPSGKRRASTSWRDALCISAECRRGKAPGEPYDGKRHVRFDEGTLETERWARLRHRHMAKAAGQQSSLALRPPRQRPTLQARNVTERLPKPLHASVRRALRQAWELDDADKAERLLRNLARRLDQEAPGVAASILEGLDEMLTVNRLGLPVKLRRSLACTNSIENMMGTVRRVCRNVKRWRNAAMALRWTAAGMMEAAKGFRRLKAYKHLPVLRAALAAHQSKYVTQRVEHDADAA